MSDNTLSQEAQLQSLLYQYVNLYDRWSEDRQVFVKKGADLSESLTRLQSAIEGFESLDQQVREKIIQELNQLLPTVRNTIAKAATHSVENTIRTVSERLDDAVNKTEAILKKSRWEIVKSRVLWSVVTVLIAVLSSVLVVRVLLPHHLALLSAEEIDAMHLGNAVITTLEGASPSEKQQLLARLLSMPGKAVIKTQKARKDTL